MKICIKCKVENPEIAIYCKKCGKKFKSEHVLVKESFEVEGSPELPAHKNDIANISNDGTRINTEEIQTEFNIENIAISEKLLNECVDDIKSDNHSYQITISDNKVVEPKKRTNENDYIQIKTVSLIKGLFIAVAVLVLVVIIGVFYIIGNNNAGDVKEYQQEIGQKTKEEQEHTGADTNSEESIQKTTEISEEKEEPSIEEIDQKNNQETEYEAMLCSDMTKLVNDIMEVSIDIKELVFDDNSDRVLDKEKVIHVYDEDTDNEYNFYPCKIEGIETLDDYENYIKKHFQTLAAYELLDGPRWYQNNEDSFYLGEVIEKDVINKEYDYELYVLKDEYGSFYISAYPINQNNEENFYTIYCNYIDGQIIFDNAVFVKTLGKNSKITVKKYFDAENDKLYSNEVKDASAIKNGIQLTNSMVNVRVEPNTDSTSLGKAMKDECYEILSEKDNWSLVNYAGEQGYIRNDFVKHIINGEYTENDSINTEENLCELAKKYYQAHNGQMPPVASIDSKKGSEVTIHLYEIMEYPDYPEENHASTWGWYYIDAETLTGTDFFGKTVDLNEVKE